MIRNWLRSPCPEAFFAGSLVLAETFSLLLAVYRMTGGIFQGILGILPFFLFGGGIALLLLRFIRTPEKYSILFPLALTAAACVPVLFSLLSPTEKLFSTGMIVLGTGIFLPGTVLLSLHRSRAVRPMAWGFFLVAPLCFFLPEGWNAEIAILLLLVIITGFCRKKQFVFLIPLAATAAFFFFPVKKEKTGFLQEKIPVEQIELTELILSLQQREPWKNPVFLPVSPCRDFLEKCRIHSGKREKRPFDLMYVCPGFSGPASDVMFRTLSPEGLRKLREQLSPSGVLAITLPELSFLPEKEADRFRAQVFAEAGRIFPHVYCSKPPLRLLLASESPEITLDGAVLSERLDAIPQRGTRVDSPHEVLEVVLPLLVQEKMDLTWDSGFINSIRQTFLKSRILLFPQILRSVFPFRYGIFGGFLLLAFLIRYLSAFHSGPRMAENCFRSGWLTALPFSYWIFSENMTFGLFLSAGLVLLFFFALLPHPKGREKRWILIPVLILILLFLMLFPERQFLCLILLLPAAYAAKFTIPENAGTKGMLPWFAGALVCGIFCQMLLAEGGDRIAQGLLLLSLLLP